jgi:hypothetical protein
VTATAEGNARFNELTSEDDPMGYFQSSSLGSVEATVSVTTAQKITSPSGQTASATQEVFSLKAVIDKNTFYPVDYERLGDLDREEMVMTAAYPEAPFQAQAMAVRYSERYAKTGNAQDLRRAGEWEEASQQLHQRLQADPRYLQLAAERALAEARRLEGRANGNPSPQDLERAILLRQQALRIQQVLRPSSAGAASHGMTSSSVP